MWPQILFCVGPRDSNSDQDLVPALGGFKCLDSLENMDLAWTIFPVWEEEVQISEMGLRNPGLHVHLISKVHLEGPEWSQREVNEFRVTGGS